MSIAAPGATADLGLTDEQRDFAAAIRSFAERERFEVPPEDHHSEEAAARLAELGWYGLTIDEEYGGAGGTYFDLCVALEELARVDSSMAITVEAGVSLGAMPIYRFGTEEQKQEWLPRLCAGEALGAFGLTEPGGGSDAGATRTTARLEDGSWVINGSKQFITNAGTDLTALVTVTAVTGTRPDGRKEISAIIVPSGTPGFAVGQRYSKVGWNASDTRELSFSDVRVPEENLVGERGRGYAQFLSILDEGRIAISALSVGLAQGCVDESVRYAAQRQAFGHPIADFQGIQWTLADMATRIDCARLLVYRAARLKDADRPFSKEASMAKLYASETAMWVATEAVQIHGGYGYSREYDVQRYFRDAKITEIYEGTSEIQRLVIARHILRD